MLHALLHPRGLAAGRTLVGVSMLTRPTDLPRLLGVDQASSDSVAWIVQMLGAREVALGVGALTADGDKRWLAAGVLSDVVDAVAVGTALRRGSVARTGGAGLTAVAAVATLIGARALARRTAQG